MSKLLGVLGAGLVDPATPLLRADDLTRAREAAYAAAALAREASDGAALWDALTFQAIAEIRAHAPHACILVLTGGNNPADIDDARKAGAAAYLTKDRIAELIPAIHDLGGH